MCVCEYVFLICAEVCVGINMSYEVNFLFPHKSSPTTMFLIWASPRTSCWVHRLSASNTVMGKCEESRA